MNHKITYTHSTGTLTKAAHGTFGLYTMLEDLLQDEHVIDDSIVVEPLIVAPVAYNDAIIKLDVQEMQRETEYKQLLKRTGR